MPSDRPFNTSFLGYSNYYRPLIWVYYKGNLGKRRASARQRWRTCYRSGAQANEISAFCMNSCSLPCISAQLVPFVNSNSSEINISGKSTIAAPCRSTRLGRTGSTSKWSSNFSLNPKLQGINGTTLRFSYYLTVSRRKRCSFRVSSLLNSTGSSACATRLCIDPAGRVAVIPADLERESHVPLST